MGIKLEISTVLRNGLKKLKMFSNDKPTLGLKFVSNLKEEPNSYVKLHLLDAKKHNAIAVYFRYFEDRPPIPQIYIYEEDKLETKIGSLHKELWSSCKTPLFFILSKTEIKVFNSLSKNTKIDEIEPIEIIKLASDIKNEFKARMFDTGEFWNTTFAKNFSYDKSAYECLLDSLRLARNRLIETNILPKEIINKLIIKSILIRYLEERKVFGENYWEKFSVNAKSFIDVCEDKRNDKYSSLVELLNDLSNHFNGGIFKLSEKEKDLILKADLNQFILFLRGDINVKTLQRHFWDLYSFKDLPIELISNIYELFLENKKGVVYTPSILVNFMIDELMPLDKPKDEFKIIDPACGSGIFLVGAYKRHIQWWMIKNNLNKPSIEILKSIIKNNIFGIDEKSEAVELAKFSLSLALCDVLSPEAIWKELHFDDLSKNGNLISNDFFNVLSTGEYDNSFDLVIGNPPFVSELTTPKAHEIELEALKIDKERPKLPDNQLALLFLEQSFKLCKENHYVCMVQPSAFLYTNNTKSFRDYLFKKFSAKQIIDFAGLNTTLFKRNGSGADVAVSIAFFQNVKPDIKNSKLLHITVRETFESREKLYFDLSYYDFHWIDYCEAIENKYIWKCNLVGGSRVVDIVKKLSKKRTLFDYLKEKKELNGWIYCTGFILGNKKNPASHLYKQRALQTKPKNALSEVGIDWGKTYVIEEENFEAPRDPQLFEAPLVIIRNTLGKDSILIDYSDEPIAFSHSFVGISAEKEFKSDLKRIVRILKEFSKEYIFYLISTSGKAGIDQATVLLKKNIDILPFPQNLEELSLSKIDNYYVEDTIDYMFDWIKGSKNLAVLNNVTKFQLKTYQEIYCDVLNTMYEDYKPLEILLTEEHIITSFYYKIKPDKYLKESDTLDRDLENLINEKSGDSLNIKRIFKIYDKNIIYIIKPRQYRFWLKSIAIRDADETFADLIKMRYN